jgi:uncharacterized protein (DUF2235 family)
VRPPHTHVVLLDGTMSSLKPGCETNIGLTYRLLVGPARNAHVTLYYEPGIQWRGFRRAHEVVAGVGINRQIRRAYLFLARNYQPGRRVVLMGYSRGAYAVRSLAGLIDGMGLLRAAQIDEETLDRVYSLYREAPDSAAAMALRDARCHAHVEIAFLGVFDTVRALGSAGRPLALRGDAAPLSFPCAGPVDPIARHALALDETRDAYAPVLWEVAPERAASGAVEQMWFRGAHGDVGGQLDGYAPARPLSNIPLTWMLSEAEGAGLPLPHLWRARYITDASAPASGTRAGRGKWFVARHARKVGRRPLRAGSSQRAGRGQRGACPYRATPA